MANCNRNCLRSTTPSSAQCKTTVLTLQRQSVWTRKGIKTLLESSSLLTNVQLLHLSLITLNNLKDSDRSLSKKTCVWAVNCVSVKVRSTLRTPLNATASCISMIFPRWTVVTSKTLLLPVIVALLNVKTKIIRTPLLLHKRFLNVPIEKNCNLTTKASADLCRKKCRPLLPTSLKLTEQLLRQTVRLTKLLQYVARIKRTLNWIFPKERKLLTRLTSLAC